MITREEIKQMILETDVLSMNAKVFLKLKKQKDLMEDILEYCKFLPTESSFSQKLYHWMYEIDYIPVCKICHKESQYKKYTAGYKEICSRTCFFEYNRSTECNDKRKQTFIEKYGGHPMQNIDVKNKLKQTNLDRYGVENVFQSEEIKDRLKEISMEKYGVDNPSKSDEIKDKIRQIYHDKPLEVKQDIRDRTEQTNLKRYGTKSPLASEEVKEKIKRTFLDRYGVENVFQSEEIKEKIKQTNLDRYGVENVFQSEEIKDRLKEISMEKYGVDNPSKSDEIKDKIRQIYHNKPFKVKQEIENKRKEFNLLKYKVPYILQVKEVKEKIKQTNLLRYGFEYPLQSDVVFEKKKQTNLLRYGFESAMHNKEVQRNNMMSMYKTKTFTLNDGTEIYTQGYGYDFLEWYYTKNKYDIDKLQCKFECDNFEFYFNNKFKIYRPDFQISNKILEVKSFYS